MRDNERAAAVCRVRQERIRQQPPKSKRASNALIDNFPSLTHRDRSQSQPSGEAIGLPRCVRAHGLMRQRIDSPGQRRSRSSVLQMDLILELLNPGFLGDKPLVFIRRLQGFEQRSATDRRVRQQQRSRH